MTWPNNPNQISCQECGSTKIYMYSRGQSDPMHQFEAEPRCIDCSATITDPRAMQLLTEA